MRTNVCINQSMFTHRLVRMMSMHHMRIAKLLHCIIFICYKSWYNRALFVFYVIDIVNGNGRLKKRIMLIASTS